MRHPSKTFIVAIGAVLGLSFAGWSEAGRWIAYKHAPASHADIAAMTGLAGAKIFCLGPIGNVPESEPTDQYFVQMLHSPKAGDLFAWAHEHGTPEGQMLALLGIRLTAPERFRAVVQNTPPATEVFQQSGCIGSTCTAQDIVAQIEAGYFDALVRGK